MPLPKNSTFQMDGKWFAGTGWYKDMQQVVIIIYFDQVLCLPSVQFASTASIHPRLPPGHFSVMPLRFAVVRAICFLHHVQRYTR